MMMRLNSFFIFLFSFLSFSAFSQNQKPVEESPCKNEGFNFSNHQLVLNSNNSVKSRLFLIRNTSTGVVMVNHQKNPPGASAGWDSRIEAGNWSAIAMNQPNFALGCMLYNPPRLGLVDCQIVLNACAITPKTPQGSFWIAENQSLLNIFKTLKQRNMID